MAGSKSGSPPARTKLLTVVGARPQFVKASAVSRAIALAPGVNEVLVHTGQHFDDHMSAVFFRELALPTPAYTLGVNGGTHGDMTGRMLQGLDPVISRERPDAVLVYGDTNSTLAGALAAAKAGVPILHVEAGLRSFNRSMPEEFNRVLTDHVSTMLFCPTATAVANLAREGIGRVLGDEYAGTDGVFTLDGSGPWVTNVGDVMLDALRHYRRIAEASSTVLRRLGLKRRNYGVLTIHRAENTADSETLESLLSSMRELAQRVHLVFVVHPRTRALLDAQPGVRAHALESGMLIVDALPYLDFLHLQANARVIVTDSGGVQKEACFLGVPCLTLRDETEWPETVASGANRVVGRRPGNIAAAFELAVAATIHGTDAFGSGDAAPRIVRLIEAVGRWQRHSS
jgi:UDP-GlcNAc3NAcA epimerase